MLDTGGDSQNTGLPFWMLGRLRTFQLSAAQIGDIIPDADKSPSRCMLSLPRPNEDYGELAPARQTVFPCLTARFWQHLAMWPHLGSLFS